MKTIFIDLLGNDELPENAFAFAAFIVGRLKDVPPQFHISTRFKIVLNYGYEPGDTEPEVIFGYERPETMDDVLARNEADRIERERQQGYTREQELRQLRYLTEKYGVKS